MASFKIMWGKILLRSFFLVLITSSITVDMQNVNKNNAKVNSKRSILKPEKGFFTTLIRLASEQWADTSDTFNKITKMLNENFIPDGVVTSPAPPFNPNASTTKPPYRISRNEFLKIIRRNVKGLRRLYNLEYQDALKQSRITDREFRKNATREFAKFL